MNKNRHRRRPFWQQIPLVSTFMLGLTVTALLLTFQFSSPTAHAASLANDPLVTIAVDKTQRSSCTETFQTDIGTSHASTKQIPCPAGTIMSTATVHRSQAIAQHEAYVLLPSSQASSAIHQQYLKQIQALHASKQAALRPQMSAYMLPATACGGNGSASLQWNLEGAILNANISFYRSSDCSSVYFQDSQINTGSQCPISDDLEWFHDSYAGYEYTEPQAPYLCPAGHHFHLVSQSAPTGYYYENDVIDGQSSWHWDNIGPIN